MSKQKTKKPKKQTTSANLGFEEKLWASADKLRNNMDAATIFLKRAAHYMVAGAPPDWEGVEKMEGK